MVERVKYDVIRSIGKVEIRRYPKLVLATVYGKNDSAAFNLLFNYISGANKLNENIAMTAPVVSIEDTDEALPETSSQGFFTFVMPTGHDLDTLPEPDHDEVELHTQEEKTFAVLRFGGRATRGKIDSNRKELLKIVSGSNLSKKGGVFLMRYNSPFTPGFLRRNEVGVEVLL